MLTLKIYVLWTFIHTLPSMTNQSVFQADSTSKSSLHHQYFNDEVKSIELKSYSSNTDFFSKDHQYNNPRKMFSRTGFFLRIGPDGSVRGTTDCSDKYIQITTFAIGPGLLVIRGTETGLFLSMDQKGKVSARNNTETNLLRQQNFDIFWREKFKEQSCFVCFRSLNKFRINYQASDRRRRPSNSILAKGRYLSIARNGRTGSSNTDTKLKNGFYLTS